MLSKEKLYIDRCLEAFESRAGQEQKHKFNFSIADLNIKISILGQPLVSEVMDALIWGCTESDLQADIEFYVVQGFPFPSPPWSIDEYQQHDLPAHLSDGAVLAKFDFENNSLSIFDRDRKIGIYWCQEVSSLSVWTYGAPLRNLFTWALLDQQIYLIHAAGVSTEGNGYLISGYSGAGKSTTTMACMADGFTTVGDDYCALSLKDGIKAYSLYGFAKVVLGSIGASLIDLSITKRERSDNKVHVPLGKNQVREIKIDAVVLPKVSAKTGSPVLISPGAALIRFAPSTIFQNALLSQHMLKAMGGLLSKVPTYLLEVGPDISNVSNAIRSIKP